MKVTENSTYRLMNSNLDRVTNTLQDLRNIGATGLKLNEASDDVSAIRPVLTTRTQIRHTERYLDTMGVSLDKMQATDGHLGHLENILQRVKEIGISAINSAMSDADLQSLSDEVYQLRDELLDTANAMIDGKYIFAGYNENTKPFIKNPNGYNPELWDANNPNTWPYVYTGDGNPTRLEILPGELLEANVTGNDLFFGIANSTMTSTNYTQPPLTGIQHGTTMSPAAGSFTVDGGSGAIAINTADTTINYAQAMANQLDSTLSGNDTGLSVTVNPSSTVSSGSFTPAVGPYSYTVNGVTLASSASTSAAQFDSQLEAFIHEKSGADPTSAGGSIVQGNAWFKDANGTVIEIRGNAKNANLSFFVENGADIEITETATDGGFTSAPYNNATHTTYGTINIGTNSLDPVTIAGADAANAGLTAGTLDAATAHAPDPGRLDIFSALTRMAESLQAGNIDDPHGPGGGISQNIDNLERTGNQERRIRSRLGNRAARVETATLHQQEVKVDLQQVLSRYQDADIIEIFNEIVKQETAYQAALNITSKVSKISILDYF